MKMTKQTLLFGIITAFAWLAAGCASVGEIAVPAELPEVTYISPKNADGVQDELSVPLAIVEGELRRVKGYQLTITDAEDSTVRVVEGSVSGGLKGLFGKKDQAGERLLIWDGRSDGGEFVVDGEYRYQLEAWGARDIQARSPLLTVVVDDTPPYVELSYAYAVFSPNGDGRRDTLTINQRHSTEEERWDGEFQNAAGSVVRSLNWSGRLSDFNWEGGNDSGTVSPDGKYSYLVRSTDLAGNSASYSLTDITIDTRPSSITLDIDLRSFSPNADGKKDLLRFYPKLTRSEDVVEWQLEVVDEEGDVGRTIAGKGVPPGMIVFDGKDAKGQRLSDGFYLGVLSILYGNGDNPTAPSPQFQIDTTMPRAALSAPHLIFSPDGDGRKDTLTIRQFTSVEKLWNAEVVNGTNQPVKRASWQGSLLEVTWDGTDDAGQRVPDGRYTYRVSSTDEADNANVIELKNIRVDTRPTPVSVSPGTGGFSPNGDGIMDNLILNVNAGQQEEIESWTLTLVQRDRTVRKTFSGGEDYPLPTRISWNGRGDDGKITEGMYQARLSVEYEKGNLAESQSTLFQLDITPPQISLKFSPQPFSPDADGVDDALNIRIEAKDSSPIEDWIVKIVDPMEHDFASFSGRSMPTNLTWNGRSRDGELVQSAEDYPVYVTVRDNVWNAATLRSVIPVDVLVMREGDKLKIIISSIYFKPYTADYTDKSAIDPERVEKNLKTLDRLAEILKKYHDYKIQLEGHAVMIYWDQPAKAKIEQEEVLLPLSQERAGVIKTALVQRGVRADRMSITGYGGLYPVVPHGDLDNRWKSRRVEFILVKQ
ncbi:MAG: gliding motility-associated C-terminal domain-containing protein [Spirochaetaceae bacterium]|nr:MAG: gliding motility-associated C-terminal domain-containing protein [Spirochaetaceae bacterium]